MKKLVNVLFYFIIYTISSTEILAQVPTKRQYYNPYTNIDDYKNLIKSYLNKGYDCSYQQDNKLERFDTSYTSEPLQFQIYERFQKIMYFLNTHTETGTMASLSPRTEYLLYDDFLTGHPNYNLDPQKSFEKKNVDFIYTDLTKCKVSTSTLKETLYIKVPIHIYGTVGFGVFMELVDKPQIMPQPN